MAQAIRASLLASAMAATLVGRRIFCRPCLDWSERRYHIKGVVGSAILDRLLALGWFKRERDNRALRLTPAGRAGLSATFGEPVERVG